MMKAKLKLFQLQWEGDGRRQGIRMDDSTGKALRFFISHFLMLEFQD